MKTENEPTLAEIRKNLRKTVLIEMVLDGTSQVYKKILLVPDREKVFILASQPAHAEHCARQLNIPLNQYKFVACPQDLQGKEGFIVYYETWTIHPRALEISEWAHILKDNGRMEVFPEVICG